ncbi:MAG: hypothetical protein RMK49_10355 [Abditibacteriales bacterium]|nr:hypothetical protein [Abditibacteriales bacterium]
MVEKSALPYLSTLNGPSYVLHAVEVLNALKVPAANVRLLPAVGYFSHSEVIPYRHRATDAAPDEAQTQELAARLGINVRADNRLWRFFALTMMGLPPASALRDWNKSDMSLADWVRQWCEQQAQEPQNWNMEESPVERLVRQLGEQYIEFRGPAPPAEHAGWGMIRAGEFESDYRQEAGIQFIRPPEEMPDAERIGQRRIAQEVAELFFTQVFLALACADVIGGFDFDHRVEPEAREIDVTIHSLSGIEDVVAWVNAYPHRAVPKTVYHVEERERRIWEAHWAERIELHTAQPQRFAPPENIFDTAETRWTAKDPGIEAMFAEIRAQYRAGRTAAMTAAEMLALARKHLPDYIPYYPRQMSVTGGLNLGGIVLRLMEQWLDSGAFLGITREDWERFAPEEQVMLWALLLYRRAIYDYGALFQAAVGLLVHPRVDVDMEQFIHYPSVLGTPFAQPGKTMVLNGASTLHSPEIVVRLPFDRTEEGAEQIEAKLEVLRRLFVPVHVPIRYEWAVRYVNLERPCFPLAPTAGTPSYWDDTAGLMRERARQRISVAD